MWVCAGGGCSMVVWVCADDGCGFVPVVGLGCGFVWFGLFGFVFFFEVALVDVGLCWWWPLVLLPVVAVGDDDDDSDRDREEVNILF